MILPFTHPKQGLWSTRTSGCCGHLRYLPNHGDTLLMNLRHTGWTGRSIRWAHLIFTQDTLLGLHGP